MMNNRAKKQIEPWAEWQAQIIRTVEDEVLKASMMERDVDFEELADAAPPFAEGYRLINPDFEGRLSTDEVWHPHGRHWIHNPTAAEFFPGLFYRRKTQ